jgi:DNA-directed RNA polymerase subunit RPC12/RpoP
MPITVSCSGCQANLRLRDEYAGKKIRCPKCKAVIQVPLSPDGADDIIETESAPEADQPVAAPPPQRPAKMQPCPECGARIPAQAQSCPACGAELDEEEEEEPRPRGRGKYVPCPRCEGTDIKKVKYTFWGSFYGPQMFHHVRCEDCGYAYNGKTGGSNLLPAILFITIPLILIIAIVVFMILLVSSRLTPK